MNQLTTDRRMFLRMPGLDEAERQTILDEQRFALLAAEGWSSITAQRLAEAPEYSRVREKALVEYLSAIAVEEGLAALVRGLEAAIAYPTTELRLEAEARTAAGRAAHMSQYPHIYAEAAP